MSTSALTSRLPDSVDVYRSKVSLWADGQRARARRGTTGWFDAGGEPGMCHRRHQAWFASAEDVARLAARSEPTTGIAMSAASLGEDLDPRKDPDLCRQFPALTGQCS